MIYLKTAIITLSREGCVLADRLAAGLPDSRIFVHKSVGEVADRTAFDHVADLTRDIFTQFRAIVFVAPCGVAVRAIAPCLRSKKTDPAVVVVDAGGRYAVSLLSGHEGGANELTVAVADILRAEPVITTTTEALKTVLVGIGCRKGIESAVIVDAVREALREAGAGLEDVRFLASADIKAHEEGLLKAARILGLPLRFISSEEIRSSERQFHHSDLVEKKVNLPAVAEPAALLAGRRTRLILPRRITHGVTVAVARESSPLSESAPADL